MEETVVESPYCTDLDPVTRQRYQQLLNKSVKRDPNLMTRNDFSTEPKDLPTINSLVPQMSCYTKQQLKGVIVLLVGVSTTSVPNASTMIIIWNLPG